MIVQIAVGTAMIGNARRDILFALDNQGAVWQLKLADPDLVWKLLPGLPVNADNALPEERGFGEITADLGPGDHQHG